MRKEKTYKEQDHENTRGRVRYLRRLAQEREAEEAMKQLELFPDDKEQEKQPVRNID